MYIFFICQKAIHSLRKMHVILSYVWLQLAVRPLNKYQITEIKIDLFVIWKGCVKSRLISLTSETYLQFKIMFISSYIGKFIIHPGDKTMLFIVFEVLRTLNTTLLLNG